MNKKYYSALILLVIVSILGVGMVGKAFSGQIMNVENYYESAKESLGAIVGPYIYETVYFFGGAVVSEGSFTVSTTGDFSVSSDMDVDHFEYGETILASSTSNSAETMPVSYLTTYSSLDYTPGLAAVTLTLPATSTMTGIITTAGQCFDWRFRNLDSVAATSTTIAAGAGMDLVENENGDVVIEGGNEAQLKFCRELDTDVTVYVDEYIAAD